MKKTILSILAPLLTLIVIAGATVLLVKGTFDDAFINSFNNQNSTDVINGNGDHENNYEYETLAGSERIKVQLNKRKTDEATLKLLYSYQIQGGTSARLDYIIKGDVSDRDLTIDIDTSLQTITIEVLHPFSGIGEVDFITTGGAKDTVMLDISEYLATDIYFTEEVTSVVF